MERTRKALEPNALALAAGRVVPRRLAQRVAALAVGEDRIALCLHRVGPRRDGERHPAMNIHPRRLDALVESLDRSCPGRVTLTFDDGYADAVDYVAKRALRFPRVDWLLFVCPEKAARGVGFRWDADQAYENAGVSGKHPPPREAWGSENLRGILHSVARRAEFALAGVERLREVAKLRKVTLGNHTNSHLPLAELTPEQATAELERSRQDFEQLFGPMRQFAFPFGTPGVSFRAADAAWMAATGAITWSTEARTYATEETGVLPRFAVDGTQGASSTLLWIAYRALLTRARRALERRPPTNPRPVPRGTAPEGESEAA